MRCISDLVFALMTTFVFKWSSRHGLFMINAYNLHESRSKKSTRRQQAYKSRGSRSDRNLQITINVDETTVTSTNSTTDFPTPSPTFKVTIDPNLIDPRSCKSGKGRTCTPSARPSVSPSGAPSISHMPTISFQPSAEPSISHEPSVKPSFNPSNMPSVAPSKHPTPKPSEYPSQEPSISSPPTMLPSSKPSDGPTVPPTIAPTVSSEPSISARPTISPVIDPNGTIDRIITDDDGHTGIETQCRRSIPSTASTVTDQLITYEYDVTTTINTDIATITDKVAIGIQKEMSNQFLTCTFDDGISSSFDTHTVSSLPNDVIATSTLNCSTTDGTLADCYRINAAFTATIFYINSNGSRSRELQNGTSSIGNGTSISGTLSDSITDPNVYEAFTSSLQSLFDSGKATSGINNVLDSSFQGIVNDDSSNTPNTTDPGDDDETIQSDSRSLNGGEISGIVIGVFIGLALIVMIIAFFVSRRQVDSYKNNKNEKNRSVDVTQLDNFNNEIGIYYNEDADETDDDHRAMIDRSIIASDDGSYNSGYNDAAKVSRTTNQQQQQQPQIQTSYIIDDDQETYYTTKDFPALTEPSFTDRIRSADQPGPTFVKTNEILYQLNEAAKGVDVNATDRALTMSGQRDYKAPDTVQL